MYRFLPIPPVTRRVIAAIVAAGGRPLVVGGAVRDTLMNLPATDFDIEVYSLAPDALEAALRAVGTVQLIGQVFGVFKVTPPGGTTLDVSLPRRENKIGAHHRDFRVEPDPAMTPQEAARRRDFTANSAAWDPQTAEILDFYGAKADITAGVLRMVDERAFAEDPLRVLRGVRFAARFGWQIEERTALLCRQIADEYPALSIERVWTEWEQWARGNQPGAGLRALAVTGWIRHYPELAALIDLPQDPTWHPEGDVLVHTGYVCDAMAALCVAEQATTHERLALMFAALCHDLGKATTTVVNETGRLVSPGHAESGTALAERFLTRIGAPVSLHERVPPLVAEHMALLNGPLTDRAIRRLARRLGPARIIDLRRLIEADRQGRPPLPSQPLPQDVEARAAELGCNSGPQPDILLGRDLIGLGLTPGKRFGEILRAAAEAQAEGDFTDHAGGMAWLAAFLNDDPAQRPSD
ncbi:MAG: CCA tRNA nucleotidyltransferase [Thermomicrobiales bacterium]